MFTALNAPFSEFAPIATFLLPMVIAAIELLPNAKFSVEKPPVPRNLPAKRPYTVVLLTFVAEMPALKGCLAQGETLKDTLQELMIVRDLWLETAQK